jgi:hypothetical protein
MEKWGLIRRNEMEIKKAKPDKKVRVTLDITPQFNQRLERLELLIGASSKADVIRQALQVYEYLATQTLKGYTFKAISRMGEAETFVILGSGPAPVQTEQEAYAL